MEACLEHPLMQHDRLYRLAYKEYLENDFEAARTLALEAIQKAQEFRLLNSHFAQGDRFSCRATTLLQAIERRTHLAQDE